MYTVHVGTFGVLQWFLYDYLYFGHRSEGWIPETSVLPILLIVYVFIIRCWAQHCDRLIIWLLFYRNEFLKKAPQLSTIIPFKEILLWFLIQSMLLKHWHIEFSGADCCCVKTVIVRIGFTLLRQAPVVYWKLSIPLSHRYRVMFGENRKTKLF